MPDQFMRTRLVLGPDAMGRLASARVIVFGIGGVGGFATEALARSGVGAIDIVDRDVVDETNINRQVIATLSSVGRPKVDVMAARIADINPACRVGAHHAFYLPATAGDFDLGSYDYVLDCVDTVTAKLALAQAAQAAGTPFISAMGAANKLDPTRFEVADIYETSICPLARIMRKECRKRGIGPFKVVYSQEEPTISPDAPTERGGRRVVPGSVAWVPSVAGLIMAGEVVRALAGGPAESASPARS